MFWACRLNYETRVFTILQVQVHDVAECVGVHFLPGERAPLRAVDCRKWDRAFRTRFVLRNQSEEMLWCKFPFFFMCYVISGTSKVCERQPNPHGTWEPRVPTTSTNYSSSAPAPCSQRYVEFSSKSAFANGQCFCYLRWYLFHTCVSFAILR